LAALEKDYEEVGVDSVDGEVDEADDEYWLWSFKRNIFIVREHRLKCTRHS
jgi:hypothetical protein